MIFIAIFHQKYLMPLFFNKILTEEIHFMVWNLTETLDELLELVNPDENDKEILESISHETKKKEYLAGKNAIAQMCLLEKIPFDGIEKDEHGKPFLRNSNYEISVTHTLDYIGVVLSKAGAVGIDIEKPRHQIFKVISRLCSKDELDWVAEDIDKATMLWSAKEALYKLYGKRKVDFKENLTLVQKPQGLVGRIKMPDYEAEHKVFVQKIAEYWLVIAY